MKRNASKKKKRNASKRDDRHGGRNTDQSFGVCKVNLATPNVATKNKAMEILRVIALHHLPHLIHDAVRSPVPSTLVVQFQKLWRALLPKFAAFLRKMLEPRFHFFGVSLYLLEHTSFFVLLSFVHSGDFYHLV